MADSTIRYMFLLIALFLALAYFVGLSTDINAFSAGVQKIIAILQGRTSSGQLAAYPKAA